MKNNISISTEINDGLTMTIMKNMKTPADVIIF